MPPRGNVAGIDLSKLTEKGLAEALRAEDPRPRASALRDLKRRGTKGRGAALQVLDDADATLQARAAALGYLESVWDGAVESEVLNTLLRGDPDLSRMAAEALGRNAARGNEVVHGALLRSLADNDPAERRAVALAIGRVGAGGAAEAW